MPELFQITTYVMAGSCYVHQTLFRDQNPAFARVFDDSKLSLFLEPDDPSARVEVYVPTPTLTKRGEPIIKSQSDRWPTALDREREGYRNSMRAESTSSPNLRLLLLRNSEQLRWHISVTPGPQVFFIRQYNSYSPLSVTHELFETLVSQKRVWPKFKDYVLYMGEREREVEIIPPKLRWAQTRGSAPDQGTSSLECMYGLRFVELNENVNVKKPSLRWSLRQSAIYCRSSTNNAGSTWIFVTPSKMAQHRLEEYFSVCLEDSSHDPFEIHLLLLDSAIMNWRLFLIDLATETDEHAARLLGSAPDNQGPESMNPAERQAVMMLDDRLLNAALVLKSTSDIVKSQLGSYKSIRTSGSHNEDSGGDSITSIFSEQLQELELLSTRADALRARIKGITNLLSSFLDLSSGYAMQNLARESAKENEQMRKLSHRMHKLTEKGTQDAAAVKVLTIMTLIYLPATVVSNFFSTSFVNSEPSSETSAHIVISHDWWIFAASSIPLTLLTLYIWLVWMRIQAYRRYPRWWWRLPRSDAVDHLDTDTGVAPYQEKV